MVSAFVKGRFGNNLFIQAAAFCFALKHGLEYHCPENTLAPHIWPNYFTHLSNPKWEPELIAIPVNDGGHRFKELEFKESWRNNNIMIGTKSVEDGYFQSHLYISGYEPAIRKAFKLEAVTMPYTCSIHYRGGDYHELKDKHPPITADYLRKAIETMIARTGCQWYFVYTDDIPHCTEVMLEVVKVFPGIRFVLNLSGDEEDDFSNLMSHANAITANSSFSVLAAILNPNHEKIVVCPHEDNYFGINNKHLSVDDLYPPNWIRIKY